MSSRVKVVGTVNAGPSNAAGTTNLSSYVDLGIEKVYPSVASSNATIASSDGSPFVVAGFTAIRVIAFRSVDGAAFKLKLTSAPGGADQVIPCDDLFVLHVPLAGDEITALKVVGTGRIEYFLAGT